MASRYTPLRDRLLSRLIIDRETGCLLWTGALSRYGYGKISVNGSTRSTHRVTYEMLAGPIPDGLELDHLCRVRHCCAPAHLEPVSGRENKLRGETLNAVNAAKTHCINGHEFDLINTRWDGTTNQRHCRQCCRERWRQSWRRRQAQIRQETL